MVALRSPQVSEQERCADEGDPAEAGDGPSGRLQVDSRTAAGIACKAAELFVEPDEGQGTEEHYAAQVCDGDVEHHRRDKYFDGGDDEASELGTGDFHIAQGGAAQEAPAAMRGAPAEVRGIDRAEWARNLSAR